MPRTQGPRVTFYGVRGSTPCSSHSQRRYGGNTSCVVVECDDREPIVFDMGTGLREYGGVLGPGPTEATLLVTHLHWDHVQGLPFFGPIHHPESKVRIYGPPHGSDDLATCFRGLMQPPYFPIGCEHLPRGIDFVTAWDERLAIGDTKVTVRSVPHTGMTSGYRVEIDGFVITYVSDHQEPIGRRHEVDDAVLELCEGADLVIHDAQFTPEELDARQTWGHCTPAYAVEVAAQAGASTLVMFHHDPWHDDDMVDRLLAETRELGLDRGLDDVVAAAEGTTIVLGD